VTALPDEADELYCVPLEQFVPERSSLVKALRADKRREEAAAVAKLPKPSLAAWAVNQVVRSQPKAARALWEAGDSVLAVQDRAVTGKATGAQLREAIAAQREALAPLADAARGMLTARGSFLGEQAVQSVIETLHAAAVDRAARPDVEAGRLARPLRLAGLGAIPSAPGAKRDAPTPPEEVDRPEADRSEEAAAAAETDAAARREAARAERERAKELARARAAAERAVARAERARDSAAARADRLRADLTEAEAELARLEEDLEATREELDDA